MNFTTIYNLLKNQGLKYVSFRAVYEFKRKTGFLKSKFPSPTETDTYATLSEWKTLNIPFFFQNRNEVRVEKNPNKELAEKYRLIKSGWVQYFNKEWKKVKDWTTNPITGYQYKVDRH